MRGAPVPLLAVIGAALLGVDPAVGAGDGPGAAASVDRPDRDPLAPGAEVLQPAEGSTRMAESMESRPEYTWLRQFKEAHGWELMRRYGAHGLGIGWKRKNGGKTERLALIFYVDRKSPSGPSAAPPIPPAFTFTPTGSNAPVELPTDVVETPAATLEAE